MRDCLESPRLIHRLEKDREAHDRRLETESRESARKVQTQADSRVRQAERALSGKNEELIATRLALDEKLAELEATKEVLAAEQQAAETNFRKQYDDIGERLSVEMEKRRDAEERLTAAHAELQEKQGLENTLASLRSQLLSANEAKVTAETSKSVARGALEDLRSGAATDEARDRHIAEVEAQLSAPSKHSPRLPASLILSHPASPSGSSHSPLSSATGFKRVTDLEDRVAQLEGQLVEAGKAHTAKVEELEQRLEEAETAKAVSPSPERSVSVSAETEQKLKDAEAAVLREKLLELNAVSMKEELGKLREEARSRESATAEMVKAAEERERSLQQKTSEISELQMTIERLEKVSGMVEAEDFAHGQDLEAASQRLDRLSSTTVTSVAAVIVPDEVNRCPHAHAPRLIPQAPLGLASPKSQNLAASSRLRPVIELPMRSKTPKPSESSWNSHPRMSSTTSLPSSTQPIKTIPIPSDLVREARARRARESTAISVSSSTPHVSPKAPPKTYSFVAEHDLATAPLVAKTGGADKPAVDGVATAQVGPSRKRRRIESPAVLEPDNFTMPSKRQSPLFMDSEDDDEVQEVVEVIEWSEKKPTVEVNIKCMLSSVFGHSTALIPQLHGVWLRNRIWRL